MVHKQQKQQSRVEQSHKCSMYRADLSQAARVNPQQLRLQHHTSTFLVRPIAGIAAEGSLHSEQRCRAQPCNKQCRTHSPAARLMPRKYSTHNTSTVHGSYAMNLSHAHIHHATTTTSTQSCSVHTPQLCRQYASERTAPCAAAFQLGCRKRLPSRYHQRAVPSSATSRGSSSSWVAVLTALQLPATPVAAPTCTSTASQALQVKSLLLPPTPPKLPPHHQQQQQLAAAT
jgi:hypothetical protein